MVLGSLNRGGIHWVLLWRIIMMLWRCHAAGFYLFSFPRFSQCWPPVLGPKVNLTPPVCLFWAPGCCFGLAPPWIHFLAGAWGHRGPGEAEHLHAGPSLAARMGPGCLWWLTLGGFWSGWVVVGCLFLGFLAPLKHHLMLKECVFFGGVTCVS